VAQSAVLLLEVKWRSIINTDYLTHLSTMIEVLFLGMVIYWAKLWGMKHWLIDVVRKIVPRLY
jgi:hypothetical protein